MNRIKPLKSLTGLLLILYILSIPVNWFSSFSYGRREHS